MVIFTVATKKAELDEIAQLISVAREYITGLRMELARKELSVENPDQAKRAVELSAYFTHCQLQPAHLQLSLRSAMTLAYKIKNFSTASLFARRLLELGPAPAVAQQVCLARRCLNVAWQSHHQPLFLQAKKLQQLADKTPTDDIKLDYDQYNPFVVDAIKFAPIYRGSPSVTCPFCGAAARPESNGSLCPTCDIAKLGASATGLRSTNEQR